MLTIQGKATKPGVAIAVAAVIDTLKGINGVSPALLHSGIDALKKNLEPQDYPEAVVACDNMVMGMSLKIPGVRTVGLAVQPDEDVPGLEPEVPCVVGLPDLLKSISDGDILIVDGNRGVVHIDPDSQTLIHYQHIEERREARAPIFITGEHLPAKTQGGVTVSVHACVSEDSEMVQAVECGADGLIVDLRGREDDADRFARALRLAAGKPVAFAVEFPACELLRAAMRFAVPNQVTVLLPLQDFDERLAEGAAAIEELAMEAFVADLQPPRVNFGILTREQEYDAFGDAAGDAALVIDLRKSSYLQQRRDELPEQAPLWIGARRAEDVTLIIGQHIELVEDLVRAGVRSLAVTPEIVSVAKYAIRSTAPGEEA